jgi:hypothetical protein
VLYISSFSHNIFTLDFPWLNLSETILPKLVRLPSHRGGGCVGWDVLFLEGLQPESSVSLRLMIFRPRSCGLVLPLPFPFTSVIVAVLASIDTTVLKWERVGGRCMWSRLQHPVSRWTDNMCMCDSNSYGHDWTQKKKPLCLNCNIVSFEVERNQFWSYLWHSFSLQVKPESWASIKLCIRSLSASQRKLPGWFLLSQCCRSRVYQSVCVNGSGLGLSIG